MSNLPKIEKGIPIQKATTREAQMRTFLSQLEVGDSFSVTHKEKLSWNHYIYSDNGDMEFISRKQEDGTVRIWRKK